VKQVRTRCLDVNGCLSVMRVGPLLVLAVLAVLFVCGFSAPSLFFYRFCSAALR
jgi:hypothetical protein